MEERFIDRRAKLKEKWDDLRATSGVFEKCEIIPQDTRNGKKKDEWGFCISEIVVV